MKKLLLLPFCLFVCAVTQAANWHPFPFSISYYSRPVSFASFSGLGVLPANGPLISGSVVEGIYLDSTYQASSNSVRSRSNKFPDGLSWTGYPFSNKMHQTGVLTNADSSMVIWLNKSYYGVVNDSLVFYPKQNQIGNASQIQTKTFENVLGTMDSVLTLTFIGRTFRWSKNFGLIQLQVPGQNANEPIKLIGSPTIEGSWKPFTGKPALPTVGDEFHCRKFNKGVNLSSEPFCGNPATWSQNLEVRLKVLEYPHQGNTAKMLIEKIVCDSGALTGILYSEIADTSAYLGWLVNSPIFRTPGTYNSNDPTGKSFGYFYDDKGMTSFFLLSEQVFDGWPYIHFFSCGLSANHLYFDGRPANTDGICPWETLDLIYPNYIKSQASCTMGTPLPPVTITSVSALSGLRMIQISPNPATGSVRIQVPGMELESLSFELIHSNGKTTKGILNDHQSERTLNLNGFSSGLYILRISNGQETRTEKLIVE